MRDYVLLYINGCRHQVAGKDCFLSLTDYLRHRCGLVGTKIVCSEGDCGSCTVLIGRPSGDRIDYRPVDACIQFLFQLDGTHVVTVEGLGQNGKLTPVQEAMVRCHGSQCGYCTPGFVVAMTGMLEDREQLAEEDLRYGLTGNLCRCTGYVPIIQAGVDLNGDEMRKINDIYVPAPLLAALVKVEADSIAVDATSTSRRRQFFSPRALGGALDLLAQHPNAKVVAGATDVGVQLNKGLIDPDVVLDLNRVRELEGIEIQSGPDGDALTAGARATWTEIENTCQHALPEFHEIVSIFGSPQIRHVGTLGGNIINASPIADSLPLLLVMEAELELQSVAGTRSVNITDFYRGYKQIDIQPGELLTRVRVPLPASSQQLRLFKVSRRRDLDIATFTAAILMELNGAHVKDARIAFGAVGPTVVRARRTEQFLRGQPFTEPTMQAAGDVAVAEITPISDVRGSEDFRFQLTRNILLKFYHEQRRPAYSA